MRRLSWARTRLSLIWRALAIDALDRNLRLEHLAEMPADRLPFTVRVGREQDFGGVLERGLQFGDVGLLVGRNDVIRGEVAVDVHAHAAPGLVLDPRRDLLGRFGQVADVANARHDGVAVPEEALQCPGFGRRLDNYKWFSHKDFRPRPQPRSRARPVATLSLSPDGARTWPRAGGPPGRPFQARSAARE